MPSVEPAHGGSGAAGSDGAELGTPAEGCSHSHTTRHTQTTALGLCCCVCNNRAVCGITMKTKACVWVGTAGNKAIAVLFPFSLFCTCVFVHVSFYNSKFALKFSIWIYTYLPEN